MATHALAHIPREYQAERRNHPGAPRDIPAYIIDAMNGDIEQVRRLHPGSGERGSARHALMRDGEMIVLDRITAMPDLGRGTVTAYIPCLDIHAEISRAVVEQVPQMLDHGAWVTVRVGYTAPAGAAGRGSASIIEAKLVRTVVPEKRALLTAISGLTSDEWFEVLCESLGRNPGAFNQRQRWIFAARGAGLAERNLNVIEMGPAGTAKSYTASISPYAILLSGKVTLAGLFHNLHTRQPGALVRYDLVALDDVNALSIDGGENTVAALKGYMEDGKVTRTGTVHDATSSLLFLGNLPVAHGRPQGRHLFDALPRVLQDPPLWDRMHASLPGWEMDVIRPNSLYSGPALAADVTAEILRELRSQDWTLRIRDALDWDPRMSVRDIRAVVKLTCGVLKELCPAGNFEEAALREAATVGCEFRQYVYDAMRAVAPGEFEPRTMRFAGMAGGARPFQAMVPEGAEDSCLGRATGLGANPKLGTSSAFAIQATLLPVGVAGAILSGTRGNLQAESVRRAHAYLVSNAPALGIPEELITTREVDIHLERRWNGGDGPSAGAAITLAMASVLTGRRVRARFAVTGTIEADGTIGSVGGVALKVRAAAEASCPAVCVPRRNEGDLADVPPEVLGSIEVHLVDRIEQVLEIGMEPARRPARGTAAMEHA